jgi:hypothetical protein
MAEYMTILEAHGFDSPIEQVMWEYHVLGLPVQEISSTLFKVGITVSAREVGTTLRKLYTIIRKNQMN